MERTLEERLRAIVAEELNAAPEHIVGEASLIGLCGSTGRLNGLIIAVEDEFAIVILKPAQDAIRTFKELLDYVATETDPDNPADPYSEGVLEPFDDEDFDIDLPYGTT